MPASVEKQRTTLRLASSLMSQVKNEAKKGHVSVNRYVENLIIKAMSSGSRPDNRQSLVFPRLPEGYKVSEATENLPIGKLPQGVSFEQETERMWEELSR